MNAVMFDFSGTLFHIESAAEWLDELGLDLSPAEREDCVRRLTETGALPGGPPPLHPPEGWSQRDVTAERHRSVYTAQTRAALLPLFGPERADRLAAELYRRHMSPGAWRSPYPDAEPVLSELRRRGVPVAVVSNIGWDLRPVFVHGGLDRYVDAYVLSYELEAQKPDPRIFRAACELLGHPPEQVLMVGDDLAADGGATALGCAFHHVRSLPVAERPDGLLPVLDLVGSGPLPGDRMEGVPATGG
ncbi:HAD family hydrolase [Streptacidiphilus cavernicola]|uniref:HAD family hydrolase n=1 Tax=Streptacidiphilus cavernicola TaxID=3342716 RepID=A0ABV6VUU9_9ACTN